MSSTSSILAGYDNNNGKKRVAVVVATGKDIPKKKKSNNKGADVAVDSASINNSNRRRKCGVHLNNLWSFWYGMLATGLQAYATVKCLKRILGKWLHFTNTSRQELIKGRGYNSAHLPSYFVSRFRKPQKRNLQKIKISFLHYFCFLLTFFWYTRITTMT